MRISTALRICIAMVLAGVLLYPAVKYWVETRDFNPVYAPVKLENGATIERRFSVNVGGTYWADISIPPHPWNRQEFDDDDRQIFRWEIRDSSGKEVPVRSFREQPDGTVRGRYLGYADLSRGTYTVKVVVLNAAPGLSKYRPTLDIRAYKDPIYDDLVFLSFWLSAFLIVAGVALVLRRTMLARRERAAEERAFEKPPIGACPADALATRVRPKPQFPARAPWNLYSHWSLYIVCVFVLIIVVELVYTQFRLPVYGIWVRVLPPQVRAISVNEPRVPRVVVRAVCDPHLIGYMIDNRILPVAKVQDQLKQELARQANWTVYVEGDEDCALQDVVGVSDIAIGLGAKVVLLTPNSRDLIESDPLSPLGDKPAMPIPFRRAKKQ